MIGQILLEIIAPILVLVGLGALLKKKFDINLATLSKLNIYLFVPAFIFDKVSTSTMPWASMGGIVLITGAQIAMLGAASWGVGRLFNVQKQTLVAIALATMFYNSGNYGLPLAELAYPHQSGQDGGAVQTFVILAMNCLTWTVGLTIAASLSMGASLWSGLSEVLRLPMIPTLMAALTARWWLQVDPTHHIPISIAAPARFLSGGLVGISLVTLGAQLASNPRWPRWRPVSAVLGLRLIFGPIQMGLMLYAMHFVGWKPIDLWPWPAALLILTSAVPTAINTLLMTLEFGGDAELAADCVFWTTVLSCVTITVWLVIIRMVVL